MRCLRALCCFRWLHDDIHRLRRAATLSWLVLMFSLAFMALMYVLLPVMLMMPLLFMMLVALMSSCSFSCMFFVMLRVFCWRQVLLLWLVPLGRGA